MVFRVALRHGGEHTVPELVLEERATRSRDHTTKDKDPRDKDLQTTVIKHAGDSSILHSVDGRDTFLKLFLIVSFGEGPGVPNDVDFEPGRSVRKIDLHIVGQWVTIKDITIAKINGKVLIEGAFESRFSLIECSVEAVPIVF
jgi:hypothetical protein